MNTINDDFKNNNYDNIINLVEKKTKIKDKPTKEERILYYASLLAKEDYRKILNTLNNYYKKPFGRIDSHQKRIEILDKYKETETLNFYYTRDYYMSLISLGEYDKAIYYINACTRIFPNMIKLFDLILLYIRCNKLDDAKKILEEYTFEGKEYIEIGKAFILIGEYEEGEKYLEIAKKKDITYNEYKKYRFYKRKLENLNNNGFIEMRYKQFKEKYTLSPGYVVYSSRTNKHYESVDCKSHKRPYLIWNIDKDNI